MGEEVLVVHGDRGRVVAERAKLVRKVVRGRVPVVETSSQTAVVMYARTAGPQSVVFVDLGGGESIDLDRPGERLLRRLSRSPEVRSRLVACTAVESPGVAARARAAGADAFAAGSEADLLAAFGEILDGKAPWPKSVTGYQQLQQQPRFRSATLPEVGAALHQGALSVEQPSLLAAAQISRSDAALLIELDALVRTKRRADAARGTMATDDGRGERRWAAQAYVRAQGVPEDEVDAAAGRVLLRLDTALVAIGDALRDELYHPQARAALALSMLDPDDAWRVDGAAIDLGGGASWRGLPVDRIAIDSTLPVSELRALWQQIDELLTLRAQAAGTPQRSV